MAGIFADRIQVRHSLHPRPSVGPRVQLRLRLSRIVPFPRDAAFRWWTDFQEDDHDGADSPAMSVRRVLRRTGNEVWLQDRAMRPARLTIDEHVYLDPPKGYAVDARYPGADIRYTYRFEPENGGTRVDFDLFVRPRHFGQILVPLTKWWWRRYAERDLDFHVREMVRDFLL